MAEQLDNELGYYEPTEFRAFLADCVPDIAGEIRYDQAPYYIWRQILEKVDERSWMGKVIVHTLTLVSAPDYQEALLKTELVYYVIKCELGREELQRIYMRSKATIVSELPPVIFDIPASVINLLWEMMMQEKENRRRLPILDFAQRLVYVTQKRALDTAPIIHQELQRWIERAYRILSSEITDDDITQMRKEIKKEFSGVVEEDYAHLLIEIEQKAIYGSDEYYVEFILWDAQKNQHELGRTEEPIKKSAIPDLLTDILEKHHQYWQAGRLILEFSLPFKLFSMDIHEWEDEILENRFSAVYPIHIRSLERQKLFKRAKIDRKADIVTEQWKECWATFSQSENHYQFQEEHVFWVETIQYCADPVIWSGELREEPDKHCVAFAFDPCTHDVQIEILRRMTLFAGLLGTVWVSAACQSLFASTETKQEMTQSLNSQSIRRITQELKAQRNKYRRHPKHIANYLRYMWDTPERIPRKYLPEVRFS